MRQAVVVDTNVLITANGDASHTNYECMGNSIQKLLLIYDTSKVVLDESSCILAEYQKHLDFKGEPGVGDMFFRWIHDNQANPNICSKVNIQPVDHGCIEFEIYPNDDSDLSKFDYSDRKFVATAIGTGEPVTIINSTDTDWLTIEPTLTRYGIQIENLCLNQTELKTTKR